MPWKDGAPPESADEEWVEFTKKWKYGEEQRAAVLDVLDELLAPYDAVIPPDLWKSPEIWAVVGYGGYALVTGQDPVFCPAGPTSLTALTVAKALTSTTLVAWAVFVFGAVKKEAAQPAQ